MAAPAKLDPFFEDQLWHGIGPKIKLHRLVHTKEADKIEKRLRKISLGLNAVVSQSWLCNMLLVNYSNEGVDR